VFYRICLVCFVLILSLKPGIGAAQTPIQWRFSHTFNHKENNPLFKVCFPDDTGRFAIGGVPSGDDEFGDNPKTLPAGEKIDPGSFKIQHNRDCCGQPPGQSFNYAEVQVESQNPEQVCVDFRISYFWDRPKNDPAWVAVTWNLFIKTTKR
jgi:hypothetical protein